MEEVEPPRNAPVPSPHPFSELDVNSALLELTPEKLPRCSRRSRKPVQLKQHDLKNLPDNHIQTVDTETDMKVCQLKQQSVSDHVKTAGTERDMKGLSVPALHTTAPLYHKLQQHIQTGGSNTNKSSEKMRTQIIREKENDARNGLEMVASSEEPLPQSLPSELENEQIRKLRCSTPSLSTTKSEEDVIKSGDGEEGRYSHLVAVDVSEESFQRLTTCPRITRARGRGRKEPTSATAGPNIMDFFSPDFEVEDIFMDQMLPATELPEPVVPSINDALTLYHLFNRDL